MTENRGQWASRFGFVMAAAGSAVGLGNVWRFPYLTSVNGGGAFVLIYILCVVMVGVPVLMNEMAIGRLTKKNTIGALQATGAHPVWVYLCGVLALCVSFFVLSYYTSIAGWAIGYMYTSVINHPVPFTEFIAESEYVIPLFALAMLTSIIIVLGGISGGIEKATKIMMPMLFILLLVTIARSLTLPGASKGIEYYLIPDFTKITGKVVLQALTQAFFSLGIGWGIMITYGSYLKKDQSIVSSSLWVAAMDSSIALLAGLMIFPALFSFNMDPKNSGSTLVFEVLANIFPQMPFGNVIGAIFFLLLYIAAITSTISMVEVVGSWLIDSKQWGRKKATWTVGIAAFIVGIPAALSNGGSGWFSNITFLGKKGVMDIMDYVFGTLFMLIVVLTTCLYAGWAYNTNTLTEEIADGSDIFQKKKVLGISPAQLWMFFIRFVCPAVCLLVLGSLIKNLIEQ